MTPKYEVKDISIATDEFRPDPRPGKLRSERELFDSALKHSL